MSEINCPHWTGDHCELLYEDTCRAFAVIPEEECPFANGLESIDEE